MTTRPWCWNASNAASRAKLRRLWVVQRSIGRLDLLTYKDGYAYLIEGGMFGPCDLALAWHDHERSLAEEAAASVVLSNPQMYFGKIRVVEILG